MGDSGEDIGVNVWASWLVVAVVCSKVVVGVEAAAAIAWAFWIQLLKKLNLEYPEVVEVDAAWVNSNKYDTMTKMLQNMEKE